MLAALFPELNRGEASSKARKGEGGAVCGAFSREKKWGEE